MSLYSKNLTSVNALKKEKALLKEKAKFSMDNIMGSSKVTVGADEDKSFGVDDAVKASIDLFTSKGGMNTIMALAMPLLSLAKIKVEKKMITSVAKEILGGYVKWKAVYLGYKTIIKMMNKK